MMSPASSARSQKWVQSWPIARSISSGSGSMLVQGISVAGRQRRWIASS
jgi:hypothetical protein